MAKKRGEQTVWDLVMTLVVLLGGVVLVVALLPRHHHEAVTAVDTAQPLRSFRNQAPFPPYAPVGLPAIWKPTSVHATLPAGGETGGPTGRDGTPAATLTIGYVVDRSSDARTYVRFDQTDETNATSRLLPAGSNPAGTVALRGTTWQVRRDGSGHTALTRTDPRGVTLLVSDGGGKGGAGEADLRTFAASVAPLASPGPSTGG